MNQKLDINFLLFKVTALSFLLVLSSCQSEDPLFKLVEPEYSHLRFNNQVVENESNNMIDYEYFYNGAGMAVADFDNDGLQDLYFAGNSVINRLYLNRGDLQFEDVTEQSGTGGDGRWQSGVTVVDINNDGWIDIYISVTRSPNPQKRRNTLFVNEGLNKDGIPVFSEQAKAYGLDNTTYSTHAAFLDYDNDGDLDMYQLVSGKEDETALINFRQASSVGKDDENIYADRLYRNDWDPDLGHAFFTDISEEAGIIKEGFGLGLAVADINRDGWKDIYASNDYISSDLLWINNRDGTFIDHASEYFKHTSFSGMGTDIQDINNDGLMDVVTIDMLPADNYRKKTMTNPNNYTSYSSNAFEGHQPQYTRNTLQLNRGWAPSDGKEEKQPVFSEIALLAGIAETDWSWGPIVADFDNDGYKDMVITNGIVRDITDKDFLNFRDRLSNIASRSVLLDAIPKVKISNRAYRNNADLTFADVTNEWGLKVPSYSTSGIWCDLDNDGDLDLVINNINDPVFLYENTLNQKDEKEPHHWLQVKFRGDSTNVQGLGSWVDIYYNGRHQTYEHSLYRGYLSSMEEMAHFGLGKTTVLDSAVVRWPGGTRQTWKQVEADQVLVADAKHAVKESNLVSRDSSPVSSLFRDVSADRAVTYLNQDSDYDDFKVQRLLPHKLSQYGPGLVVGDINGDEVQDIIIGGSAGNEGVVLLQQDDGTFSSEGLESRITGYEKGQEDQGLLLFDADKDGDLDLYKVGGGIENTPRSELYQDRLFENDGQGNFVLLPDALPPFILSGSAVRAADYDRDGDLDLFVGGRVVPGRYPEPVSSYVLRNDSRGKEIHFTDVTEEVAPFLRNLGLVTDALWTDFNNDGWQDLVITGEWMPITFLKNKMGEFEDVTDKTGISGYTGWWNSIAAGDFDNDGDTDYMAGNLGLNSLYQATYSNPVSIYAKDFERNGIYTAIPTVILPDEKGRKQEYPSHSGEDLTSQLVGIRAQFSEHKDFGRATIQDILNFYEQDDMLVYKASWMQSSYVENKGSGTFSIQALPVPVQFAPVFGMVADDFDRDGNLDLALSGNEFGGEPKIGRYDAFNGLMLSGNGDGTFSPKSIVESGIYIPGDGKALVKVLGADGRYLLAASQNKGALKVFENRQKNRALPVNDMDISAVLHYVNGNKRKEEFYYGTSFLSASGRFLSLPPHVTSIGLTDAYGNQRIITFDEWANSSSPGK